MDAYSLVAGLLWPLLFSDMLFKEPLLLFELLLSESPLELLVSESPFDSPLPYLLLLLIAASALDVRGRLLRWLNGALEPLLVSLSLVLLLLLESLRDCAPDATAADAADAADAALAYASRSRASKRSSSEPLASRSLRARCGRS